LLLEDLVRGAGLADLHQPGDIAQQVDLWAVANPPARARTMAMQLAFADDLAQGCGIEQAAQLARSQAAGVSRHGPFPSRARRRSGPGGSCRRRLSGPHRRWRARASRW